MKEAMEEMGQKTTNGSPLVVGEIVTCRSSDEPHRSSIHCDEATPVKKRHVFSAAARIYFDAVETGMIVVPDGREAQTKQMNESIRVWTRIIEDSHG